MMMAQLVQLDQEGHPQVVLVRDHGKDLDARMTVSGKQEDNVCSEDLYVVSLQHNLWHSASENALKHVILYVGRSITGIFFIKQLNALLTFIVVEIFKTNYLFREAGFGESRDNCEMSDRDTRELDAANPAHFDNTANEYDFYERALGRNADDCLDGTYLSIIHIPTLILRKFLTKIL